MNNSRLSISVDEARDTLESLVQEIENLEAENEKLQQTITSLEDENEDLKEELSDLKTQ